MLAVKEALELIKLYKNRKDIKPNSPVVVYLCREGTEEMLAVPVGNIGCDPKTGTLFFTLPIDDLPTDWLSTMNVPPTPSSN